MTEQEQKHESFGLLKFTRTRGGNPHLFGSSIKHNEKISMEISPAKITRDLSSDWYGKNGIPYIEAEMSYSQFAEAITSMNIGEGIPVTITQINGKNVEALEFENKRIQFENEFKEQMLLLEEKMSHLTEAAESILINKKSVTKGDRESILKGINSLKQEVRSNIPFVQRLFNEQMDKTVREAKGEIEAFTARKVNELGVESLQSLQNLSDSRKTNILIAPSLNEE